MIIAMSARGTDSSAWAVWFNPDTGGRELPPSHEIPVKPALKLDGTISTEYLPDPTFENLYCPDVVVVVLATLAPCAFTSDSRRSGRPSSPGRMSFELVGAVGENARQTTPVMSPDMGWGFTAFWALSTVSVAGLISRSPISIIPPALAVERLTRLVFFTA